MKQYTPKTIEPKWQKWWKENNTYTANLESAKPKYMASGMFNYPSGQGIHVGHAYTFTIPDVLARFKRQQGFESLNPVGWDAFGLPAENYAIKMGISPQESLVETIQNYHEQYTAMGWGVDWTKEINSSEPLYYKWTQWIFSQMFKHGLAYQDSRMQWWCDQCQTVLANEQVDGNGKCWRHDKADDPQVEKREVKQWFFKITEYADALLEGVDGLDWTESVKLAQKNWIGRSEGAEIKFKVASHPEHQNRHPELDSGSPKKSEQIESEESITVFTTRADTLFGATFMVLAPENDLALSLSTPERKAEVENYIKLSGRKTEVERQASKEKTGVFTGSYAVNPVNNQQIPIYVADYVLGGYGTGAIMAVPAHDERDHEFALKFNLPITQVIAPTFTDSTNPHVNGKKTVPRDVVTCIVISPNEDKILIVKPKGGVNWSPLMGGIDGSETPVEAAKRELLEESGYTDIASIEECGNIFASEFFAKHKDLNRIAYCTPIVIKLRSLEQNLDLAIDHDEQELKWVSRHEYVACSSSGGMIEVLEMSEGKEVNFPQKNRLIKSGTYSGLTSEEAKLKIVADLEKQGLAKLKVNYKMRDWSVSRQRYWGAPIPIINCKDCGEVLVPDEQLPVVLPELDDFKPSGDGRSALARAKDWLKVDCPQCGGEAERETDTLDTYIDSSWYLYRYIDPFNQEEIFNSELVNKWFPINFYDGADHATAHLLYARFIGHFFTKLGIVNNPEPIGRMLYHGKIVGSDGTNFSKSAGNGVDPREVINSGYGADALRLYLMFAAPPGENIRWNPQGGPGTYRFLTRVWDLIQDYAAQPETELDPKSKKELKILTNVMIKKVSTDIEASKTNTAIAALMECLNGFTKLKSASFGKNPTWKFALESFVACLAPFAPHIAEELWQDLGYSSTIHHDTWPKWDEAYLQDDQITIVVQVNGKVRAELKLSKDADKVEMESAALENPRIQEFLSGQEPKKVIVVPGRLVNLVV